MPSAETTLPEFRDWSIAAIRLLQGVVYIDDEPVWNILQSNKSRLEEYLARLGLKLVVDDAEGFAFLQQLEEEELPPGYDRLPRLFRKTPLSYGATLLCVLLRDELRRFEEEEVRDERCAITTAELFERWKAFFPPGQDDVKLMKSLRSALATMQEELRFIRLIGAEPEEWEIRCILKARMPVAKLETLLEQLKSARDRHADRVEAGGDHE